MRLDGSAELHAKRTEYEALKAEIEAMEKEALHGFGKNYPVTGSHSHCRHAVQVVEPRNPRYNVARRLAVGGFITSSVSAPIDLRAYARCAKCK